MPSHLDILRRVYLAADAVPALFPAVDDDLNREAGMNGYLARLLQSARDLDAAATEPAPTTGHTPGPWAVGDSRHGQAEVYDSNGWIVWYNGDGIIDEPSDLDRANARRIVACVNALDGIDDPAAALAEVRETLARIRDGVGAANVEAAYALTLLGAR